MNLDLHFHTGNSIPRWDIAHERYVEGSALVIRTPFFVISFGWERR